MKKYEDFKFKTKFDDCGIAKILRTEDNLAIAAAGVNLNLDNLAKILPPETNIKDNPDVLYFVAPGSVANLGNKNFDLVSGADTVKMAPFSIQKYLTIEHRRNGGAQGVIASYGFAKHKTDEIISSEEAAQLKTPFDWVVGGLIWETLSPGLVNYLLECSEPSSKNYGAASLSWELFFSDYSLLVGSADLSQGEIIDTSNETKFNELSQYLKANGGEGKVKQTNEPIYRLIIGEMLPGGFSITNNPAAEVKGLLPIRESDPVASLDNLKAQENKEKIEVIEINSKVEMAKMSVELAAANVEKEEEDIQKSEISTKIIEKTIDENKKSVNNNTNLKNTRNPTFKYMKFKSHKDITADKLTSLANDQAVFIAEQFNDYCDKFANDLDAEKLKVTAKETEIKDLKASVANLEKQTKDVQSKLEASEQARAAQKETADLNTRLNDLTSRFELTEKGVQAIAKQIKGLDEDKYGQWLEFAESTFAAKKVADKTDDSDDEDDNDDNDDSKGMGGSKYKNGGNKDGKDAKNSKASIEDDYDFESVQEDKNQTKIKNGTTKQHSLAADFADAFKGWETELSAK